MTLFGIEISIKAEHPPKALFPIVMVLFKSTFLRFLQAPKVYLLMVFILSGILTLSISESENAASSRKLSVSGKTIFLSPVQFVKAP